MFITFVIIYFSNKQVSLPHPVWLIQISKLLCPTLYILYIIYIFKFYITIIIFILVLIELCILRYFSENN